MKHILDYVEHWAAIQPDKCFASFLNERGIEIETYTYAGFHDRTRRLAEHLYRQAGVRYGDRALLVYPPGLELIVAFIACTRIGAIPVPVRPLRSTNFEASLANLTYVARDCDATVALTAGSVYESHQLRVDQHPDLKWIATDAVHEYAGGTFHNSHNPILFLQYTSGSTSDPKGVVVSHKNVIHNCKATLDHVPTGVSWLPQYHDMGLIGYYLFPLITGGTTYGLSPLDFLKRPALWLQSLSRFKATYASSPNFGFEYCLREDKISSEELAAVDLGSLRVMMNASEPVCVKTQRRFFERFAPYGLRPDAHVVAYGLAENTLAVTHHGRRTISIDERVLASCGKALDGIHVQIVDPKSHLPVSKGQIGEIWVTGDSTCEGYWNRPELTREIFHNHLANSPDNNRGYLRTGDLGFLDRDDLFVCGRIKDLIIIRGVNFYPQDIERVVESASPQIRASGVAAFTNDEDLIVVAELKKPRDVPNATDILRAIRKHYSFGPLKIVLAAGGAIVKTTSGKIARTATRERWLNGKLRVLATHVISAAESAGSDGERLRFLLEQYQLTGDEDYTLAELGIDSLTLVTLLSEIEQLLEQHGAADLAAEVNGPFVQRLTVAQLFSLFAGFAKTSQQNFRSLLKELKQEHDAERRNQMLNDATLETLALAEVSPPVVTDVLLTGPTGFFGPFLLRSLLVQTSYTYHALVRAPDAVSGMERLSESLHRARIWTSALDAELRKRVRIVCGDISKPNFGMHSHVLPSLANRVQAVIHNAAMVNYVADYDKLRPHNVDGTRALLRFACSGMRKDFHFISSTVIFGWTVKEELLETDKNDAMSHLEFGYAQSKWVAEQLVFAVAKQGLNVRVYRPAFISASSDGAASAQDITIRLFAFMINHGIAVNAENQISFLPADVVADNIAAIFKRPQTDGNTFHVTADNYYNIKDITELITRDYGYRFVYYDIPQFVAEMQRVCTKADPLYPLLDFFKRSERHITAIQHKRYNNDCYRRAREQSGSEPALAQIVSYLMTYMLREGLISRNTQRGNLHKSKAKTSRTALVHARSMPG